MTQLQRAIITCYEVENWETRVTKAHEGCVYTQAQLEKCPDTGRLHIQAYQEYAKPKRLGGIQAQWDAKVHVTQVKIDNGASNYAMKEETRVEGPMELGTKKKEGRPKLMAKDVITLSEDKLLELPMHQYIQAKKVCTEHAKVNQGYNGPRECFWIVGNPGVGKSRYVKAFGPYMKSSSKWWDGYSGQSDILLDDFEKDGLKYLAHYLKLWGDPYGFIQGEVKGSTTNLSYHRFWITSNYTVRECLEACEKWDQQLYEAICRRFKQINIMDDGTWVEF